MISSTKSYQCQRLSPCLLDNRVCAACNQSKTVLLAESRRMSHPRIWTPQHFRRVRLMSFTNVWSKSGDSLMTSCDLHYDE